MAIRGLIETVRSFQVRGWAVGSEDTAPLRVDLLRDGLVIASAEADLYRDDLEQAGIGTGSHGFVINVDQKLPIDQPGTLAVIAVAFSGECRTLPFANQFQVRAETPDRPVRGRIGIMLAHEIRGWAWDPASPTEPLMVELRCGGEVMATVCADMIRPDLARAGIGQGRHGFVFRSVEALPVDKPGAIALFARSAAGQYWRLPEGDSQEAVPEPRDDLPVAAAPPVLPFPGQIVDRAHHPVFILGAQRSGTTALAQAITQNTRYVGPGEGHLLDLASALTATVDRFYRNRAAEWSTGRRTLVAESPAGFFTGGIKHLFIKLARTHFPAGFWLDKTPRPDMIRAAPLLLEIWPDAKFVFLRRDPVDNVMSGLRKFPAASFASLCHNWAASIEAWQAVRAQLAGCSLEFDQSQLATAPADVVPALTSLISLTPGEAELVLQSLQVDRPERTAPVFAARHTVDTAGWGAEDIATFREICGPLLRTADG